MQFALMCVLLCHERQKWSQVWSFNFFQYTHVLIQCCWILRWCHSYKSTINRFEKFAHYIFSQPICHWNLACICFVNLRRINFWTFFLSNRIELNFEHGMLATEKTTTTTFFTTIFIFHAFNRIVSYANVLNILIVIILFLLFRYRTFANSLANSNRHVSLSSEKPSVL